MQNIYVFINFSDNNVCGSPKSKKNSGSKEAPLRPITCMVEISRREDGQKCFLVLQLLCPKFRGANGPDLVTPMGVTRTGLRLGEGPTFPMRGLASPQLFSRGGGVGPHVGG